MSGRSVSFDIQVVVDVPEEMGNGAALDEVHEGVSSTLRQVLPFARVQVVTELSSSRIRKLEDLSQRVREAAAAVKALGGRV